MTKLRKLAASIGTLFLVFISIAFASPASATLLDDALVALEQGRQELADSLLAQSACDSAVIVAQENVARLEVELASAQTAYEASAVTSTTVTDGIQAYVYNMLGYNAAPPLPDDSRLVYTTTVSNINFNWGGGVVMNSGLYEDVIVRFTGFLNVPETGDYSFYAPGDDGIKFILNDNQIINDWRDKGGGGTPSYPVHLEAGTSYPFTLWFYENGGGANVWLYWANNSGWGIVPPTAFGEVTTTVTYDENLLAVVNEKTVELAAADTAYETALTEQRAANDRVLAAELAIPLLEQAVVDATPPPVPPKPPVVEPPVVEQPVVETPVDPVMPEPPVVAPPAEPTVEEVVAEQVAAAEENDIVVPEELATIPLLGNAVVALADAMNFVSNVGADMTPEVRAKSEKVVVSAVIVGQVAQLASSAAATASASTSRKVK